MVTFDATYEQARALTYGERTVNPIDAKPEEPKQGVVKVAPCLGCGQLPHGPLNERIACLEREIRRYRTVVGETP